MLLTDTRIKTLSAILPVLGFGVALSFAMSPPLPEWANPAPPEEEKVEEVPPFYQTLEAPLTFTAANGMTAVSIKLAFLVRAQGLEVLAIGDAVSKQEKAIIASLTEQAMQDGGAEPDAEKLARILPEKFRKTINSMIGTKETPEPVLEVLIQELLVSPF